MGKKNYYVVKEGRVPGIYETWGECKKQVDGYKNACFQGFERMEDANLFLTGNKTPAKNHYYAVKEGHIPGIYESWEECSAQVTGFPNPKFRKFSDRKMAEKWFHHDPKMISGKGCRAYVDGSFNVSINTYGYGVVLLYGNSSYEFFGNGNDPELAKMRNVSGEIEGAMRAVREAVQMGFSEIKIFYDYKGIECWVTGAWKTTKDGTQRYKEFMQQQEKKIKITFTKVKAHSNVKYNEIADSLAKKSVGI